MEQILGLQHWDAQVHWWLFSPWVEMTRNIQSVYSWSVSLDSWYNILNLGGKPLDWIHPLFLEWPRDWFRNKMAGSSIIALRGLLICTILSVSSSMKVSRRKDTWQSQFSPTGERPACFQTQLFHLTNLFHLSMQQTLTTIHDMRSPSKYHLGSMECSLRPSIPNAEKCEEPDFYKRCSLFPG